MIDIHTHILPELDDGAASLEESLHLARKACEEGIQILIATPHHANGNYMNLSSEVIRHTQALNRQLEQENIPIRVETGQEIRVHDDLLQAWKRQELLTLAGSRYMLIEMPTGNVPDRMEDLIHELLVLGIVPIIAHPERNAGISRQPERLAELVEWGAFAQVTAHSLSGGFGRQVEGLAWKLMKQGLIHIVSSDVHHVERRGFHLREAYTFIERTMGEQWVSYFQHNAASIIQDKAFREQPEPESWLKRMLRKRHT